MVNSAAIPAVDKERLKRAGAKYSLICAGLGLLVAALITTALFGVFTGSGLHQIILDPYFLAPVAVAVSCLAIAAWYFGGLAGGVISRVGLASPATRLIGILLALHCMILSVTAGYLTHFFSSIHQSEMLYDYVAGPAIAVIGIGFVPALILGLTFSAMIRSENRA